jgi:hypothetical protein
MTEARRSADHGELMTEFVAVMLAPFAIHS